MSINKTLKRNLGYNFKIFMPEWAYDEYPCDHPIIRINNKKVKKYIVKGIISRKILRGFEYQFARVTLS